MAHTLTLAAGIAALAIASCGGSSSSAGATSTASGSVAVSATPMPLPSVALTATVRSVDGTVEVLHVMRLDGTIVASVAVPDNPWNVNLPVVGHHVYFVDGTDVKAVAADGSIHTVTTLLLPDLSTMYGSALGLTISPNEGEVAYGYAVGINSSGTTYASRVFVAHVGGSPDPLLDVPADPTGFLLPFAWTNGGLWVSHTPIGLGGVGPFLNFRGLNPSLVDVNSGVIGPIANGCPAASLPSDRPNGAFVCATSGNQGLAVSLPDGSSRTLPNPAPSLQLGDLTLSADGAALAVGTAMVNSSGDVGWSYQRIWVAATNSGRWSSVAPVGTLPVIWLDDSTLLVGHTMGGGPSSQYDSISLVKVATGAQTLIGHDPVAVGVLPATG
ncbi:MAG TPA: hypothetical protein VNY76_00265 [Candidatus Acidoferrales bacterium]|nr:hypothetical protein [Candidatus Acidoferrales bacterium]